MFTSLLYLSFYISEYCYGKTDLEMMVLGLCKSKAENLICLLH